jgi:hypothetical protein
MKRLLLFLIVFGLLTVRLTAQIIPAEDSRLHYRVIGFSIPQQADAHKYVLEIATGNLSVEAEFQRQRIIVNEGSANRFVVKVPSFGADYTWRITVNTTSGSKKGSWHHFSTLAALVSEFDKVRLSVIKNSGAYEDACVFTDCSMSLYDMNGEVVWFIPASVLRERGFGSVEDLKCTSRGTITYMHQGRLYEISYDGRLLNTLPPETGGQGPGFVSNIHHDATRLKNGHFMALGNEQLFWKLLNGRISIKHNAEDGYQPLILATLDEYDEKGKVVWQFKASDYVLHSDIVNLRTSDGKPALEVHPNAFFFDEQTGQIYLGLKNVSRILKIQYPQGKVLAEFGRKCSVGDTSLDQELFCQQHAISVKNGNIYVFNNNACGSNPVPRLVVLKESKATAYGVSKIWEYECKVPLIPEGRSRGGNITDLPDGNIFAALSMPYNELIIVDGQKNLLWEAKSERWNPANNSWLDLGTYRASIITSKATLDSMIWFGQNQVSIDK